MNERSLIKLRREKCSLNVKKKNENFEVCESLMFVLDDGLMVQPIWDAIINFDPQLFIHLGDNIYGDNKRPFRMFGKERTIGPWKNMPRFYPSSEQEMLKKYEMAKQVPGYSQLRKKAQVIID